MLEQVKARWFGKVLPDRGPAPAATIAELTTLCLLGPPCCGHIALCDGACRDARPDPLAISRDDPSVRPPVRDVPR